MARSVRYPHSARQDRWDQLTGARAPVCQLSA